MRPHTRPTYSHTPPSLEPAAAPGQQPPHWGHEAAITTTATIAVAATSRRPPAQNPPPPPSTSSAQTVAKQPEGAPEGPLNTVRYTHGSCTAASATTGRTIPHQPEHNVPRRPLSHHHRAMQHSPARSLAAQALLVSQQVKQAGCMAHSSRQLQHPQLPPIMRSVAVKRSYTVHRTGSRMRVRGTGHRQACQVLKRRHASQQYRRAVRRHRTMPPTGAGTATGSCPSGLHCKQTNPDRRSSAEAPRPAGPTETQDEVVFDLNVIVLRVRLAGQSGTPSCAAGRPMLHPTKCVLQATGPPAGGGLRGWTAHQPPGRTLPPRVEVNICRQVHVLTFLPAPCSLQRLDRGRLRAIDRLRRAVSCTRPAPGGGLGLQMPPRSSTWSRLLARGVRAAMPLAVTAPSTWDRSSSDPACAGGGRGPGVQQGVDVEAAGERLAQVQVCSRVLMSKLQEGALQRSRVCGVVQQARRGVQRYTQLRAS
jgi:hypothetical protein